MEDVEEGGSSLVLFKSIIGIDDDDLIDYIINLKLKIDDKYIKLNILVPLEINYNNIEEDLETISSIYGFWATIHSKYKSMVMQKETRFKSLKSKAAIRFREELHLSKKTDIEYYVNAANQIRDFEIEIIKLQENLERLRVFIKSVEMKFEALRSLAGFKRQEYNKP